MAHWYEALHSVVSLGSHAVKIANMGELHAARQRHLAQFFTPDAVARLMWGVVEQISADRKLSILDNSVGSGRLLQFADPARHRLFGVDVHEPAIDAVKAAVEAAGFDGEFRHAGMQEIHPERMDVCLLNPPFSIHLESPHLKPFGWTTWGRYGPNTSALSHEYALDQALDAAQVVVALLPLTFAQRLLDTPASWTAPGVSAMRRLLGLFELPASAFREEGAEVRTAIVVFGQYRAHGARVLVQKLPTFDESLPLLGLNWDSRIFGEPRLRHQLLDTDEPAIIRPVTSQKRVRVAHDGRRIVLGFDCGFTEAMVLNRVLDRRIVAQDGQRLPKGFHYAGTGRLDLETYLAQEDPVAALGQLLQMIADAGGQPVLAPGVLAHFGKRVRCSRRQAMPLRHVAYVSGVASASTLSGTARRTFSVDPTRWGSALVKAGETVTFTRDTGGRYRYVKGGAEFVMSLDEVMVQFDIADAGRGWEAVHEGMLAQYPDEAALLRARMVALGIDRWLDWGFQQDDLVELLLKPQGAVVAWEQGCGKSRLAVAMILLSGVTHGLLVVEARLIAEMRAELAKLPIDPDAVNVIESPAQLATLAQINLISYERLRSAVSPATGRATYAKRLRRRIGLLLADEGERLANPTSDQSRALWQLSARRRYVLTGSPIANYPRDAFGLVAFTGGDGTAAQPYGYRRGYLEQSWVSSVEFAVRGMDRFRDDFVVLEWVTWQFAESMQDGAKREVPKIANLPRYRQLLAPHVKRRLVCEPDVARYIQIDPPETEVVTTDWDPAHLAFYLTAAEDFADWYRDVRGRDGKANNLVTILARIRAVHFSANYPQHGVDGIGCYAGITSKQQAVIDRMTGIAAEGKQAILFAENPGVIELIERELAMRGVKTVPFHGGIPIKRRVADKDKRFLRGTATGLLCTKASGRAGYNLPNADYVLFYDRSWTWRIEYQAMRRALRWDRKGTLKILYFHLPGSIDVYQDQMVAHKRDATQAGLDWATPELEDETFLHMDTLLDQFVEDLATLRGRKATDMRELLKEAA